MKKMKGFRKVLAGLLVLCLIMGCGAVALADDGVVILITENEIVYPDDGSYNEPDKIIDRIFIYDDSEDQDDAKDEKKSVNVQGIDSQEKVFGFPAVYVDGNTDIVSITTNSDPAKDQGIKSSNTAGGSNGVAVNQNHGTVNINTSEISSPGSTITVNSNNGTINLNQTPNGNGNTQGADLKSIQAAGVYIQSNNGSINLNTNSILCADDGIEIIENTGKLDITTKDIENAERNGVIVKKNEGTMNLNAETVHGSDVVLDTGEGDIEVHFDGIMIEHNSGTMNISAKTVSDGVTIGDNTGELTLAAGTMDCQLSSVSSDTSTTNITVSGDMKGLKIDKQSAEAEVNAVVGGTLYNLNVTDNSIDENLSITAWSIDKDNEGRITDGNDEEVSKRVNYILRVDAVINNAVQSIADMLGIDFFKNATQVDAVVGKDENGEDITVGYNTAKAGAAARLNVGDEIKLGNDRYTVNGVQIVENDQATNNAGKDNDGYYYSDTVQKGGGWWLRLLLTKIAKPEPEPEEKPEEKKEDKKEESKPEEKKEQPKQEAVQTVADTTSTIATTGTATVYNLLKIKDTSGKAELAFRNVGKYEIKSPDGNDEGSFGMEDGKIVLTSQTGKKMNIGQDGKLEYVIGNQTYEFKFGEADLEKLAAVK